MYKFNVFFMFLFLTVCIGKLMGDFNSQSGSPEAGSVSTKTAGGPDSSSILCLRSKL